MLEEKNIKEIKRIKRYFAFDTNTNSKLYLERDMLHKIPYYIKDSYRELLNYIDECNIEELVKLRNLITNDEKLEGYSMTYYPTYKSLNKNHRRRFEDKIEDCKRIIYAFDKLNDYNLIYNDYHTGNILINPVTGDIKICDLEGIEYDSSESSKKIQLRDSIILSVAYLYGFSFIDAKNLLTNRNDVHDGLFNTCINAIGTDKFYKSLVCFDFASPEKIRSEKMKLREEAKTYQNNYYNRYF